jgi:hypothetical protein
VRRVPDGVAGEQARGDRRGGGEEQEEDERDDEPGAARVGGADAAPAAAARRALGGERHALDLGAEALQRTEQLLLAHA